MSALRLARGFTGRSRDREVRGLLPRPQRLPAGEGGLGRAHVRQSDVRRRARRSSRRTRWCSTTTTRSRSTTRSARYGDNIAAVVLEPVAGNMNFVRPSHEFLAGAARAVHEARRGADLRRGDDRLSRRAAGRAGHVRHPARPHDARQGDRRRNAGGRVRRPARHHGRSSRPSGPVYQAGTLSGNPVAVSAGTRHARARARARILRPSRRARLRPWSRASCRAAREAGIAFSGASLGGMFGIFFRAAAPAVLRAGDAVRPRGVQPLLPRDARARRLPRAVGVRGGLRFRGPRRGRARRRPSPPPARRSRIARGP